jgi:hypothetical protein
VGVAGRRLEVKGRSLGDGEPDASRRTIHRVPVAVSTVSDHRYNPDDIATQDGVGSGDGGCPVRKGRDSALAATWCWSRAITEGEEDEWGDCRRVEWLAASQDLHLNVRPGHRAISSSDVHGSLAHLRHGDPGLDKRTERIGLPAKGQDEFEGARGPDRPDADGGPHPLRRRGRLEGPRPQGDRQREHRYERDPCRRAEARQMPAGVLQTGYLLAANLRCEDGAANVRHHGASLI